MIGIDANSYKQMPMWLPPPIAFFKCALSSHYFIVTFTVHMCIAWESCIQLIIQALYANRESQRNTPTAAGWTGRGLNHGDLLERPGNVFYFITILYINKCLQSKKHELQEDNNAHTTARSNILYCRMFLVFEEPQNFEVVCFVSSHFQNI